jgi:DNA-binding NarL/FixJ family response regulator
MLLSRSDIERCWERLPATQRDALWPFHPPKSEDPPPPRSDQERGAGPQQRQSARVLLADDQLLVLDMLRDLIEPEFEVIGAVADGRSLIEAVGRLQPDMVLTDIAMPVMDGLEAGREIMRRHAGTKLICISAAAELALVAEAFSFGASGFLLKRCRSPELLHAMRTVGNGGMYLTPLIANGDVSAVLHQVRLDRASPLSAREVEVLSLLVSGQPMKEVARRLGITARTVAFHKYNIMSAHGLRGNAELVKFAMENRILR